MDERTPLLHKLNPYKPKKVVIEKDKITCQHDKQSEIIEIITNHYNLNYFFDITATNCYHVKKLGTTINGIIILISKKNKDKPSVIKWKAYKE